MGRASHGGSGVTVVGTATSPPDDSPLPRRVDVLEVRADLLTDAEVARWRSRFGGTVLYSLRSEAAGGASADRLDVRHTRLLAAARRGELVDLEADRDLALLDAIPPEKRVISAFPSTSDPQGLWEVRDELLAIPARLHRLAPLAESAAQALAALHVVAETSRPDFTAFARGPAGKWTRILAARFGARAVFGRLRPGDDPPWAPTVGELLDDYDVTGLATVDRLYGIIDGQGHTSLSPRLHNAGYRALGIPARYLPFTVADLPTTLTALRTGLAELGLPLLGVCVKAPHKKAAMRCAGTASAAARRCAAASLLLWRGNGWWADVESEGVLAALSGNGVALRGTRAAVVGCGGAGRAAALGLHLAGAQVTLINRDPVAGQEAATALGLPFAPLCGFRPDEYSLLVSAVPVRDELLFVPRRSDTVVLDLVYSEAPTALVTAARDAGLRALDGRAVLLAEGSRQFLLMTGRELPTAVAEQALGLAMAVR